MNLIYLTKYCNICRQLSDQLLTFTVDYSAKLYAALQIKKRELFPTDPTEPFPPIGFKAWVAADHEEEGFSDYIDAQIQACKQNFDDQFLASYNQLADIHAAVCEFRQYLDKVKEEFDAGLSLFESEETIQVKLRVIETLEVYLKGDSAPEDKVNQIQVYLQDENQVHLRTLAKYSVQNPQAWSFLSALIVKLLVACGLHTPKFIQQTKAFVEQALSPEQWEAFSLQGHASVRIFTPQDESPPVEPEDHEYENEDLGSEGGRHHSNDSNSTP